MIDVHILSEIELFSKLDAAERDYLAGCITDRSLAANQPVVWIGEQASEFFIIKTGQVEVSIPDESGREMRVSVLGPGEYFGELALFDGGTRSSTVRTIEPSQFYVLSRQDFRACLEKSAKMAVHILEVLGRRQRRLLEKIRGVRNVNEIIEQKLSSWQRVANFITEIAASRAFLLIHAVAYALWLVGNLVLGNRGPDPYPFLFLSFWTGLEAIFLSLFILVSQATEGAKDRLRNEQDFQVAVKLQVEIMQLHQKMNSIMARLEAWETASPAGRSPT